MSIIGFFIALISFLTGFWYIFINNSSSENSLVLTNVIVTFFAGIQLFGLGLLGEYVGRIYDEVKKRPKYILDKKINFDD